MRNGVQYGVDTADVLSTVAECDASASGGKGTTQVASAKALSELNSNLEEELALELSSRLGGLRFGVDAEGNYGYKKVGADTVIPFKTLKRQTKTAIASGGPWYEANFKFDELTEVIGVSKISPNRSGCYLGHQFYMKINGNVVTLQYNADQARVSITVEAIGY